MLRWKLPQGGGMVGAVRRFSARACEACSWTTPGGDEVTEILFRIF